MKTTRFGSRKGQSMVEGALVFLVFFSILLGIFEFGRIIWIYNMLSNAAREGTRYAIAHGVEASPPATKDDIIALVKKQMIGLDPDGVNVDVAWHPNNKPGNTVAVTVSCSVVPVAWFMPASFPMASHSEMIIFY